MTLAAMLATHNDAALEALASKGVLRRASRDFKAGKASIADCEENAANVLADGQEVAIDKDGPASATCTCPAQGICRHILLAVLALRDVVGQEDAGELDAVSAADEMSTMEQHVIGKFAGADWPKAVMLVSEGVSAELRQEGPNTVVKLDDLAASVTFLRGQGLRGALYKGAKTRKRLSVTVAALLVRVENGCGIEEDGSTDVAARKPVSAEFFASAQQALERGVAAVLPGRSAVARDLFFDLSISARIDALPRLSSELKSLSVQANAAASRDAGFEPETFLKSAGRTYALLEALQANPDRAAYAGQIRRDYREREALELWMLGAARWNFLSGARGVSVYAYSPSERTWFSISDGRAEGSDPTFDPATVYVRPLWGAGSVRDLIGGRIILPKARVSADNAIALTLPEDTQPTVGKLELQTLLESACLADNWAELRNGLANRFGFGLSRRAVPQPALIAPAGFGGFGFNDFDQRYELEVLDTSGRQIILSLDGEEHEPALRLRSLGRQIQALLVEASLGPHGLVFRPVTVITKSKHGFEALNLDFDRWPPQKGYRKLRDKLTETLSITPEPVVDAADPLQRIVSDATDAVVATVSRSSSADFAGVTLRCETGGLLGLAEALETLQSSPTTASALKAAYVAGETEAALWFDVQSALHLRSA